MIQLAISITFTLILTLIGVFYRRARKLKAQYSFVWKSSSSLKPKDILEDRPYAKYYYRRPENTLIEEKLKCRESMLIVGSPLSGKSRSVYQALKESTIKYDVIKPICCDINLETLIFPKDLTFWRPKLIFIDDLHWFVEKQNFDHLFRISRERSVRIIATCRSGIEFEKVKKKLIEKNMDIETIFSGNIIKHEKLSDNIGKELAINNNIDWNKVKFDGTIGSIFMPLNEMEKRFEEFRNQLKTLLWVIKNLYTCGIYEIDNVFHLNWIKTPSKRYELEGKDYEWSGWFKELEDKEFIKILSRDKIRAEKAYIENIVKPFVILTDLDIFEEMIRTFLKDPDVLLLIGRKAYDIGSVAIEKEEYTNIAIRAYKESLKTFTIKKSPVKYALIQNNIGNSYSQLAEIKDRQENCMKAISAYEDALKVRTLKKYPREYGDTQNSIGIIYSMLSQVKKTEINLMKAITAYEEALKVRKPEKYPLDYAVTQFNLGVTYNNLATIKNKAENCKKAIDMVEKALKIFTLEEYPLRYSGVQNNLGNIYSTLAEVENRVENCEKAIKSYEEALKVRTFERYPVLFAMAHFNLGDTLRLLAEEVSRKENCMKAISAFEQVLRVCNIEHFPIQYGMTYYNIGNIYKILAEVENKNENCERATSAYEEALKVYTQEQFPSECKKIKENIKIVHKMLSMID